MTQLRDQLLTAFRYYGTKEWTAKFANESRLKEVKYKTVGYTGEIIPENWDEYAIQNAQDQDKEDGNIAHDEGILNDIKEEDGDDEDGFALAPFSDK
jgi:hypothetical protein